VSGGELQAKIIELGHMFGWTIAHFRSVKTARGGYITPVAADGKGFPDLLLVHPSAGVIFREIKGQYEPMREDQIKWQQRLLEAGADHAVWRPKDWPTIVGTLTLGRGV
jgi:hypothetical protein